MAAPPSPILTDFGDWLSPMIVKELRQGLKTRAFVSALIILHVVLTLLLLFAISEGNLVEFTKMFWWIGGGLLIGFLPLSGFNALVGEVKGRTFDLLSLTRLGPLGIVAGKWLALIAQSGLIAISILPYVVLRYFGGGVDLPGEVTMLLFLWLFSALVSAFAIVVSAMPSVIVRALFFLSAWFWVKPVFDEILSLPTDGRDADPPFLWFFDSATDQRFPLLMLIPIVVLFWSYLCYFLLELGATAIAPVATNHATRKRLLALVAMAVALHGTYSFPLHSDARATSLVCLLGLAALAAIDCLTEPPATTPPVLNPFQRRGRLGRWLAWFLAPGWPTGLIYGFILAALVTIGFGQFAYFYTPERFETNILVMANLLLAPFVPLAGALLAAPNHRPLLSSYSVSLFVIILISVFLLFLERMTDDPAPSFIAATTPLSAVIIHFFSDQWAPVSGDPLFLKTSLCSGLVLLAYLITRAWPWYLALQPKLPNGNSQAPAP